MKKVIWPVLVLLLLNSCRPQPVSIPITILDSGQIYSLTTAERIPAELIAEAELSLAPGDRVLVNGVPVPIEQPLPPAAAYTLQIRRAVALTLIIGGQTQVLQTSAATIGQALDEAGFQLYAADRLDPPAETPLEGPLTVNYQPARDFVVTVDGNEVRIRSAAPSVGQALAEVGMPLIGLDTSLPYETEPLPADGQIRVVRVQETVVLTQKSLPFTTEFQDSADLEIDQQAILQAGEPGLAVSRVRIRYEDGQEVARQTESESIVRPPKNRILGYGTKITIRTLNTPDGPIKYWRALRVYATSYSPCRSAADRCYSGTKSGKPVQKGVVAVVRRWYDYMVGQPIYVPGYGLATIEDVGGGFPDRYWVDLGWSDDDYQPMGGWMTIYFLTPVPTNILYVLPYR